MSIELLHKEAVVEESHTQTDTNHHKVSVSFIESLSIEINQIPGGFSGHSSRVLSAPRAAHVLSSPRENVGRWSRPRSELEEQVGIYRIGLRQGARRDPP